MIYLWDFALPPARCISLLTHVHRDIRSPCTSLSLRVGPQRCYVHKNSCLPKQWHDLKEGPPANLSWPRMLIKRFIPQDEIRPVFFKLKPTAYTGNIKNWLIWRVLDLINHHSLKISPSQLLLINKMFRK